MEVNTGVPRRPQGGPEGATTRDNPHTHGRAQKPPEGAKGAFTVGEWYPHTHSKAPEGPTRVGRGFYCGKGASTHSRADLDSPREAERIFYRGNEGIHTLTGRPGQPPRRPRRAFTVFPDNPYINQPPAGPRGLSLATDPYGGMPWGP